MSFWRDFSKGYFKVSVAISVIGALVLSVILAVLIGDGETLLSIFVGAVFAVLLISSVLVSHSLWGMFIDLCENNAKSTLILEKIAASQDTNAPSPHPNTKSHQYPAFDAARTTNTLSKFSAINGENGVIDKKWSCQYCGTLNDNTSMICKDCGEYK